MSIKRKLIIKTRSNVIAVNVYKLVVDVLVAHRGCFLQQLFCHERGLPTALVCCRRWLPKILVYHELAVALLCRN